MKMIKVAEHKYVFEVPCDLTSATINDAYNFLYYKSRVPDNLCRWILEVPS